MYRWILGMVLVGGVLVTSLGACGDGGSSDSATTALTKSQFVKQAEKVCGTRTEEGEEILETFKKRTEEKGGAGQPASEREIAEDLFEESVLPSMQKELASLEELSVPKGSDAEISKMLGNFSKGLQHAEDGGLKELSRKEFEKFAIEAEEFGFACTI